ncbi:MAG: glycosyltransferase [Bacteroidota bacterium]
MKNNRTSGDQGEILILTSYPPRECGIATYSQDLITALNNKFSRSLSMKVCALESRVENYTYPDEVKYILNTSSAIEYEKLALKINSDARVQTVLVQHEFGFYKLQEQPFIRFLYLLSKPVAIVFHTVLPHPDKLLRVKIRNIAAVCDSIIVMTNHSAAILVSGYGLPGQKINVIPHGTHLVPHLNKESLKAKYGLEGRKVLTTFGLLSSGKSIETTIDALPGIIIQNPETVFLIIGKTHPEVVKAEGEKYREMLSRKVDGSDLNDHVKFINKYLDLPELLEYLQLTDIYLFTTNDPNQAVSGTFAYAMSCGCPIISTPIPHALEMLDENTGIIFDFQNPGQLAESVTRLLNDEPLRNKISMNALERIVPTSWENSAVAHAMLFEKMGRGKVTLKYNLPEIKLDHLMQMTTETGIIQFARINQPDITSGYTLDDNARALVASCMYFKLTKDERILPGIYKYLAFISHCLQPDGSFLNYTGQDNKFTDQNYMTNLDDSNGRAIWALGYLVSFIETLPLKIIAEAENILLQSIQRISTVHSPRAMSFAIKGICLYNSVIKTPENLLLVKILADRLVRMYMHEADGQWDWFEGYLTYANSILPEALLYAWLLTGDLVYKEIALSSLNFLLAQTFTEEGIKVISNQGWKRRGEPACSFGEQPIDVSYTIMTLSKFYNVFGGEAYRLRMETAFNWFLGMNHLHQTIYNPCTGGSYDGLEETHVNLNQGAESTVSYLMARITMELSENQAIHSASVSTSTVKHAEYLRVMEF